MSTAVIISIRGAASAVFVSLVGAWLANRNSIVLQTRKLKEAHYIGYIEALHNNVNYDETNYNVRDYVFARDKLLLIASEDVIRKLIHYENEGINKGVDLHDRYLTDLIKAIRLDLKITDKNFPTVYIKTWNKKPQTRSV